MWQKEGRMKLRLELLACLFVCLSGLLVVPPACLAVDPGGRVKRSGGAAVAGSAMPPDRWVAQLGSRRFAEREQATAQLIGLGMDAVAELEQQLQNADREVRQRSRLILDVILENDFSSRVERFQADESAEGPEYGFPTWPAFHKLVGHEAGTKILFVEMLQSERELMGCLQRDAKHAKAVFDERCRAVQAYNQASLEPPPAARVAAFLFVAADERIEFQRDSNAVVFELIQRFDRALMPGANHPHHAALRLLLTRWVLRSDSQPAYEALMLALQYQLPTAIQRARQVLEDPQAHLFDRYFAILCTAKYGDPSDVGRVERLLADHQVCTRYQADQMEFEVQLRDVALAALLVLTKRDFAASGYRRLEREEPFVFRENTLGFAHAADRDRALHNWRSASAVVRPH
jgi:hypothetical protein